MKKLNFYPCLILILSILCVNVYAQEVSKEASIYDYGKMWPFENAPKEFFQKTYDLDIDDAWLEDARKSALRFASWCSASFVSPNGLIMTNHHCSNGEMPKIMKEGEDFNKNGFYAATFEEERKVEGLFVEQLERVADITAMVKEKVSAGMSAQGATDQIQEEMAKMDDWANLRMQVVTYYSGGKYSLYGYKKYDDIRLVFIPELDLGFYGGDPDNFTYPRYNLDCTFWRAYDNGKPADTRAHYYKFNPEGAVEGEAVFVVGNPGSTERYRTVAQLEFDRDYRYNILLESLTLYHDELQEQYDANPNPELLNQIFSLSNSMKAFTGILKGLHDPILFGRKKAMEDKTRTAFSGGDPWAELKEAYEPLKGHASEVNLLSPSPLNGSVVTMLHQLYKYGEMVKGGAGADELATEKTALQEALSVANTPLEKAKFINHIARLKKYASKDDKYIKKLFSGNVAEMVNNLFDKSKLFNAKKMDKALSPKKFAKSNDGFVEMASMLIPAYQMAGQAFGGSSKARKGMEEKVANAVFQVNGDNLPPDATFTLRISDGVVKGYNYNGTQAPYKTSYFGLYDRHYSNNGEFPWSLPEKWKNPPMDLLKAPVNFVSTNDIIGGNSGSAIINGKQEAIGLIFDGNIESLPGNFIYEPTLNRAVSVHAGGIAAALRYIYKADRLLNELVGE